jgi:hypothetical protein
MTCSVWTSFQKRRLLSNVRIRIGFIADPDPAFYLNADREHGSQINADPDPGQTCCHKKLDFYMRNTVFFTGNMS